MDPDQELESEDTPKQGRPPRHRSALLLGIAAAAGIIIGLIVVSFFSRPPTESEEATAPPAQKAEAPSREGSAAQEPDGTPSGGPAQAELSFDGTKPPAAEPPSELDAKTHQGRALPGDALAERSRLPVIGLPPNADRFDLEGLVFPQLSYCIYAGAYKDPLEASTTWSELDSNYLDAYIVPVEVKGNVAQSLFGVTKDGIWYRVLTGHFSSKEEARKTLGVMMEELPGYQPEIMRFPYAIECGRFLVPEEARMVTERLDQEGFFPYTQTFPTSDDRTLTRILVGCYFSLPGAEGQKQLLEGKEFSCEIVER
jgi:hypothetical protein